MLLSFSIIILKIGLFHEFAYCSQRIIGGEKVRIEDFPYQASLRYQERHLCGAAIISAWYGVTAAHCVRNPGTYSVRVGSSEVYEGGVLVFVRQAIVHPKNNRDTDDYDIALLRFSRPLRLSNRIRPVKLPRQDQCVESGDLGYVSGWGTTLSMIPLTSSSLRAVQVPVVSRAVCQSRYLTILLTPRMFCAGYLYGGKDACQGDSGGPFVVKGVLYGIVSWGYDCGRAGYPGVYTYIPAVRDFITDVAGV